jgi:hypothetical protein
MGFFGALTVCLTGASFGTKNEVIDFGLFFFSASLRRRLGPPGGGTKEK